MSKEEELFNQIIRYLKEENTFIPSYSVSPIYNKKENKFERKYKIKFILEFYGETFLYQETVSENTEKVIQEFTNQWQGNNEENIEQLTKAIRTINNERLKDRIVDGIYATIQYKLSEATKRKIRKI